MFLIPLLFIPTMMAPIVVGLLLEDHARGILGPYLLQCPGAIQDPRDTSVFRLSRPCALRADLRRYLAMDAVHDVGLLLRACGHSHSVPFGPPRSMALRRSDFFQITLPMITPLFAVIGLLRLIDAFKVFDTSSS